MSSGADAIPFAYRLLVTLNAYRNRVAAEKRSAILRAAGKVFLRDGYERATMEAIAREAGASLATVYKHAASKSALFGTILAAAWGVDDDTTRNNLPPTDGISPEDALHAIGMHYAEALSSPEVVSLFRVIIAEGERFPELGQDLYDLAKRPYLDSIERYLTGAHRRGELDVPDAAVATRELLGMINDQVFWPRLLVAKFRCGPKSREKIVRSAVGTFLSRYAAPIPDQ